MSLEADLLVAFETHSPEEIRQLLRAGVSPTEPIKGLRPIDCLIEMYARSAKFAECLRVMLEAGATIDDPLLQAVLLDDDKTLSHRIESSPEEQSRRLTIRSTFTPCEGVTALHLCAEFNSVRCARVLVDAGADVNAAAALDEHGLGGQTPIFHSVNSNRNYCRPVMELLVEAGADLSIQLKGVVWGKGFEWETQVFEITPISYAQCGLYRQFHRKDTDVASAVDIFIGLNTVSPRPSPTFRTSTSQARHSFCFATSGAPRNTPCSNPVASV